MVTKVHLHVKDNYSRMDFQERVRLEIRRPVSR